MKIKDTLGAPASLSEIEAFQKRHRVQLPGDYQNFLGCHNGGRPEMSFRVFTFKKKNGEESNSLVAWFSGIVSSENYSLDEDLDTYADRIPLGMLPVARDPFGNLILLDIRDPNKSGIWFWDHEIEPTSFQQNGIYKISDSFEQFVSSLAPVKM